LYEQNNIRLKLEYLMTPGKKYGEKDKTVLYICQYRYLMHNAGNQKGAAKYKNNQIRSTTEEDSQVI
jgi:hypothetical protein